jgi:hypothetical protein
MDAGHVPGFSRFYFFFSMVPAKKPVSIFPETPGSGMTDG